ncbi:MAG: MFS transporter [Gammaproteobacteria bacterium]|nr:MFS transporter [Gammaproteobacteria bacterium]
MSNKTISENQLIALVSIIQFVHVVDFMMVAPLGPDFAKSLGFSLSDIGWIVGVFAAAAAVSAFFSAKYLDRFERRGLLNFCLIGMAGGTCWAGLATDFEHLLFARIVTGLFGGPANAVAIALIIDKVPNERRGRAMGIVMGAFSIASILGLPIGLYLATWFGWQAPFFAITVLLLLLVVLNLILLPKSEQAPTHGLKRFQFRKFFNRRVTWLCLLMNMSALFAAFLLIPHISSYIQFNRDYPRDDLGFLYLVGGLASFILMRITGPAVDRRGAFMLSLIATLLAIASVYLGFYAQYLWFSMPLLFFFFMGAMSMRNVVATTVTSMVPDDHERAAFMSINGAIQHASAAFGAFISSQIVSNGGHGEIIGMAKLALMAMLIYALLPVFVMLIEKSQLGRKNQSLTS